MIQWLEFDTITRNWYNDSKLLGLQWLEIDGPTMTRNWYNALIQCFEFDMISCSFADLISKAESFCRRICLHVLTCSRTSQWPNHQMNSIIIEECVQNQRIRIFLYPWVLWVSMESRAVVCGSVCVYLFNKFNDCCCWIILCSF